MNDFYSSLISGTISGLVTGLFVGLILYYFQKRKEENEKTNINLNKLKRRLPKDIITFVLPGISLEKTKEYLGVADTFCSVERSFFSKYTNHQSPNSYLYNFINAKLKITSADNITIDTVTIFSNPLISTKRKFQIHVFLNPFKKNEGGSILGKSILTAKLLENISNHYLIRNNQELIFGVETYHGRLGNYMNYSYFGYFASDSYKYEKTNNPNDLIGGTIEGFCISRISGFAPYISALE